MKNLIKYVNEPMWGFIIFLIIIIGSLIGDVGEEREAYVVDGGLPVIAFFTFTIPFVLGYWSRKRYGDK